MESVQQYFERIKRDIEDGFLRTYYSDLTNFIRHGKYYEQIRDLLNLVIDEGYINEVKRILRNAIDFTNTENNVPVVKFLLDGIHNPDYEFLHRAIQKYKPAPNMIRIILEAGADPNIQDDRGFTALLVELQSPSRYTPRIVELLMQYGADPTIKDRHGYDAYIMLKRKQTSVSNDEYYQILDLLNSSYDIKEPEEY